MIKAIYMMSIKITKVFLDEWRERGGGEKGISKLSDILYNMWQSWEGGDNGKRDS